MKFYIIIIWSTHIKRRIERQIIIFIYLLTRQILTKTNSSNSNNFSKFYCKIKVFNWKYISFTVKCSSSNPFRNRIDRMHICKFKYQKNPITMILFFSSISINPPNTPMTRSRQISMYDIYQCMQNFIQIIKNFMLNNNKNHYNFK